MIMLSEMHNADCMRIASLEHDVPQLKQLLQKPDLPKELFQIRAAEEFDETYILSVPVPMATPGLAHFIRLFHTFYKETKTLTCFSVYVSEKKE